MRALSSKAGFFLLALLSAGCVPGPRIPGPLRETPAPLVQDACLLPYIHAIQFTKAGTQEVAPCVYMDNPLPLVLEFDALLTDAAAEESYEVNLVSCDLDWTPSGLMPLEYYSGFLPDPVDAGIRSHGTRVPYLHYRYEIPAPGYEFKRSGNYLVKVSHRGFPDSLLFTRRIMVVEQTAVMNATISQSSQVSERNHRHRIDFSALMPAGGPSIDPQQDVSAAILQNGSWQNAITGLRPRFVDGLRLEFMSSPGDEFEAGSEYRLADLSMPQFAPARLALGETGDSIPYFILPKDRPNLPGKPSLNRDRNGAYFFASPVDTDLDFRGEYVVARFRLQSPGPLPGARVYVVGGFCKWLLIPQNELAYDPMRSEFSGDILLKQGQYDYAYAVRYSDGTLDYHRLEGSFVQTRNAYAIYLYVKAAGESAARIVGERLIYSH